MKIIFSGGGTGGHIYPAVAVAEQLEKQNVVQNSDILFVGAIGKMEMTKVADLGFNIKGLPVSGLVRKASLRNFVVIWNSIRSIFIAISFVRKFKPDVVMGFGGYASFPIVLAAQLCGIPTVLWEGNSYAGLANKFLAKKAKKVVVSYEGMEKFFRKDKIEILGNPVRGDFSKVVKKSDASKQYFGFKNDLPTIVVTGGSLGARALNDSVFEFLDEIIEKKDVNLVWQCGAYYYEKVLERLGDKINSENLWVNAFVNKMQYAYEIADLVIARSGASTVTELALTGCATIFVPSSNVTDDHQTKNAKSLVEVGAALMLKDDANLSKTLLPLAVKTVKNETQIQELETQIKKMSKPSSAVAIVDLIKKLCNE
ncbi:MAG: undecaprenyldiphospho-muramoylpentapeptide beta-N-acetylglucosaminyltransferase [Rikenellaceae bacterium]